jgi:predicted nucleotidyltransferase
MSLLERLVKALNQRKIPYAIVGGVAVALHGAPRGTIDIDIVIKHTAEFFKSAETCLKGLGFLPRLPVTAHEVFSFKDEYITRRNLIAWSFYNPTNPLEVIDIILTHDLSDMKAVNKKMGLSTLKVLSVEDLINMKKKSGRPQDIEDIKVLKEILK